MTVADAADPAGAAATSEADEDFSPVAAERLRSIIERVERLEEERKALANDIKDVYAEAKSCGFDVAVVRDIVAERRREPAEIEEQDVLRGLYRRALGM